MPNQVSFGVQAKGVGKASSDVDRLRDKFDKLQKTSGKGLLVGAGAGLGLAAVNALSGGVSMATDAFFGAVKAGSDLNETMAKSAVVFGDNSDAVSEWGDTTARSMGITKNAAIGAAAGFGDLFNKLGLGPAKAKDMSQSLVSLAADLASFNNLDPTDVLDKLRAGLSGEAEPLRRVGVFLNEAKVKAKAMELGLAGAHGELSEGAKVAARYALIMEETKSAQGDFARTSDQMANQQRILNAELEDTSAKLGQKLVPGFIDAQKAALGLFSTLDILTDGVAKTTEGQKQQADGAADLLGALGALFPAYGLISEATRTAAADAVKAADGFDVAGDNSVNMAEGIKGSASKVESAFGDMGDAAIDWRDKYRDVAGDIIRRSHRIRDALVKDAAIVRGEVFDEQEIRAEMHDKRLDLFALQERKRNARSVEDKRQASDDIVQALDDQGEALEDLADIGKLTQKDVDRFAKDAKKNYDSLSKEGRKDIDALIAKYRALANMPNIRKSFTITEYHRKAEQEFRSGKRGEQEFARGGVVRGPLGAPVEAIVHAGETVRTPAQEAALRSGTGGGGGGAGGMGGGATFNITVNAGLGSGLTAADTIGPAIYADMQRRGMLPRAGTGLRG
jgi:hypothetical protein